MSYTEMNFASGGASSAEKVSYNNSTSGLSADNVQDAIDEVNSNLTALTQGTIIDGTDDITNYTESSGNYYETPCFGFLYLTTNTASNSAVVRLKDSLGNIIGTISIINIRMFNCYPIPKGIKLAVVTNTGTGNIFSFVKMKIK